MPLQLGYDPLGPRAGALLREGALTDQESVTLTQEKTLTDIVALRKTQNAMSRRRQGGEDERTGSGTGEAEN